MSSTDRTATLKFLSRIATSCALIATCVSSISGCSSGGGTTDNSASTTTTTTSTSNSCSGETTARDLFYQELQDKPAAGGASPNPDPAQASGGNGVAVCMEVRSSRFPAPMLVPNLAEFQSGDSIRLHIRPSTPVYAYVVMVQGTTGAKTTILYPQPGTDNKLEAGKEYTVPPHGMITFDNNPGSEQMGILLSPNPIEEQRALTTELVPVGNNKISGHSEHVGPYTVSTTNTSSTPIDQSKADPTQPSLDPYMYVVNPDPSKPLALAVDLKHTAGQGAPAQ